MSDLELVHSSSHYGVLGEKDETHRVTVGHSFDLFVVLCLGQELQSFRVKFTTGWIQCAPVCPAEVRPKGVHCDDKGPPVCLKLQHT